MQDTAKEIAMNAEPKDPCRYDVLIVGAGYAGLMAALRLRRRRAPLRIGLINARDAFAERVRLQESIVADVASRIPSIAALVDGTNIEFIAAEAKALDPDQRRVRIAEGGPERDIAFGEAIYALGSGIDAESVPGVAEHAYRLELGDGPRSVAALRSRLQESKGRRLRVVAVGGAETGVEAAAEIKTAWPEAEVTMISRSRCGDFKGAEVEKIVRAALCGLGVRLIDEETVTEVKSNAVVTRSGRLVGCDVCVWSGGLRSSAIAREAGIASDPQGRIWVGPDLRSISHPHILAVGDAAHPIAPTGAPYRLSAFAALVSGAHAAETVLAQKAGRQAAPLSFSTFGQGVAIGREGVGFTTYPDDNRARYFIRGRAARHVRNFFVWFVSYALRLERRFPGFFWWPGRRRVSWQQARSALQQVRAA
jgi:NADH:ubiquinone reductase (H+-translocating)